MQHVIKCLAAALLIATSPIRAADLASPAGTPTPEPTPGFFLFSDTQVTYTYAANATEPGVASVRGDPSKGRTFPRSILTLSHADAWEYGTNFVSLDIIRSGSQDPSGFAFPNAAVQTGVGATEAFSVYRGTLSGNALTGTKAFVIPGFVKDVSLAFGTDLDVSNRNFGAQERRGVAGLTFAFDVPAGFINLSTLASKEFNRNGLVPLPARAVVFDFTAAFELTYTIPVPVFELPLRLAGFNNLVLPKGRDGFGAQTTAEFISRTNLVLDIGKLAFDQPGKLDAFVGYQFWRNKYGNDCRRVAGACESSLRAGVAFHVF